jgi:hypothetical protein
MKENIIELLMAVPYMVITGLVSHWCTIVWMNNKRIKELKK